jgi:hypothetical protein
VDCRLLGARREGLAEVGPRRAATYQEVVEPQRSCIAHHQRGVSLHVVEAATRRLDDNVVGRQSDVGVGAAIVLLDVRLEVVGVGDRSEASGQRRESGDGHVIATIHGLGATLAPCRSDNLGSGLAIRVWDMALWVVVVRLVLGMSPILDIVAIALPALHDAMVSARRVVLAAVLRAMSLGGRRPKGKVFPRDAICVERWALLQIWRVSSIMSMTRSIP